MRIQIINGPNLNLLGVREPEIYGKRAWEDYLKELRARFPKVRIDYFQSNLEGEIINKIHEVGFYRDGIVLNAGAYTHTSIAILDALRSVSTPAVEVPTSAKSSAATPSSARDAPASWAASAWTATAWPSRHSLTVPTATRLNDAR